MSDFKLTLRGSPVGPRAYTCPDHGEFVADVDLATSRDPRPCPVCGQPCERVVERALFKPQRGALVQGKVEKPRKPTDYNVESLADGGDFGELREKREAMWFAHDMDEAKRRGLG